MERMLDSMDSSASLDFLDNGFTRTLENGHVEFTPRYGVGHGKDRSIVSKYRCFIDICGKESFKNRKECHDLIENALAKRVILGRVCGKNAFIPQVNVKDRANIITADQEFSDGRWRRNLVWIAIMLVGEKFFLGSCKCLEEFLVDVPRNAENTSTCTIECQMGDFDSIFLGVEIEFLGVANVGTYAREVAND